MRYVRSDAGAMGYVRSDAGAMGYVRSDAEDDIPSSDTIRKRFKFPKKLLEDCSGVHLTTVPRKLRSAFKKRSCRSISPNLLACKKLKWQTDGVEFHRKSGLMKSSLNLKQDISVHSPKDAGTSLQLSKDEEEVAQALFALASVIPNCDKTCNDDLDGEQSGDKYSNLPNTSNSGSLIAEAVAVKAEVEPRAPIQNHDESISPVMEGAALNVTILPFVNDNRQPGISTNEKFLSGSGGDVPKVNLHLTAIMSERISYGSNGSSRVADIKFQPRSKLRSGENLPSCNNPETTREQTGTACGLLEGQCLVKDNRNTGSTFWPGLTSRISCSGEGLHSVNPLTGSHKSSSPAPKDSQFVVNSNKSWKRCLTHAHICRHIRDSQAARKIKRLPVLSSQKISEGSNFGDPDNRLVGMKNSLLGICSSSGFPSPSREKNAEEVRNAILLHKRLVQYQQQPASTASFRGQKQSLGHFSLPTGYGDHASNETNGTGRREGTSSDLFSFLHSQSQPAIHFPLFQNYYTSTSFSTEASSAVTQQVMLPPYVGPTQIGLSPLSASLPPPQQQLQKKAAHVLMAPNRSGVNLPYIPVNWQAGGGGGGGGVVDISPLLQQAQNPFHTACPSVEVIGTNYAPIFLK